MSRLPDFLSLPKRKRIPPSGSSPEHDGYHPLLSAWAIEILLLTGGHRKMMHGANYLFDADDEIVKLTGLSISECDGTSDERRSALLVNGKRIPRTPSAISKELTRYAVEFRNLPVHDEQNVFENIELLGSVLGLSQVEKAVLCFVSMLQIIPLFKDIISTMSVRVPLSRVAAIIAHLTGNDEREVMAALKPESVLRAAGIIEFSDRRGDLENILELLSGFGMLLSQPHQSADALVGRFLRKAGETLLSVDAYPHVRQDADVLVDYLKTSLAGHEHGCNVLLYGIPGTGKTEFVKTLADNIGVDLYEISFADENGDPVTGNQRLRAYNLCQRILAGRRNALLMFDEIEDVFPTQGLWQMLFTDENESGGRGSAKAWVNRSLEQNRVPAIWITNNARIDKAYLRRFDYSVRFTVPPLDVRKEIARCHLGVFNPTEEWLAGIAANEKLTPGQYDRAAKVARLGAKGNSQRALELVKQTLDRSATLLGQKSISVRNVQHTKFDLKFINASLPLEKILDGLFKRRQGTFCFYGPAGTGKSELARHIADRLGQPCIVRRASDILSKWLGETEQNIAEMFVEARQQEAVLVLDEADSFLADRRDAKHSWEVTQVNELLTQIEAFEGIFVCTTNLMERLDQASLRRFAFKVKFDYLNPDQRWAMFLEQLLHLGGDPASASVCESTVRGIERLTPGDFAVVARQFRICDEPATADGLLAQLREECRAKGGSIGKMGF